MKPNINIWEKVRKLGAQLPYSVVNTDRRYDMGILKDNPNDKLEVHKPAYDSIYAKPQTLDGLIYGEIPQQSVTQYIDPRKSILAVNSITARSIGVGLQDWLSNVSWNNSVLGTISWPEHTLALADGTNYTISADSFTPSNTNKHYIYWKKGWSEYKVTENIEIATGNNKIIVATFQKGSDGIISVYHGDTSGVLINGNNITAGRIQGFGGLNYWDLDTGKFNINDSSNDRVRWSVDPNLLAGITMPGYDVDTASDDKFLFKVTDAGIKVYSQATFSSGGIAQSNDYQAQGGFIYRDTTTFDNYYIGLYFEIPTDWQIIKANVQMIVFDYGYNNGMGSYALTRPSNLGIRLNPTKSQNGGGADKYYWSFSGGQAIATGVAPASDGQVYSYQLTPTQISSINTGWNSIIVQQETNSVSAFGTVVVNLKVEYIKTVG